MPISVDTARSEAPRPAAIRSRRAPGKSRARRPLVFILACQLAVLAAVLLAWELSVDAGFVKELYVSKPSAIFGALATDILQGDIFVQVGVTVYETLTGFVISAVLGILAGIGLYRAPTAYRVLSPFITGINNLPRLALAPLFVLWFGLDTASRVALIISLVFFVVLLNTLAGLQSASRDHLLLAKTLGATPRQLFVKFVLPAAVPTIFAGLQLGLTYSFLTAVVGEMLTGSMGLGAQLQIMLTTYRTEQFFAALVLLAIVATALSASMRLVERRLLRWRIYEMRGLS
jgi:NitT/TauT family transport system permease protein